MTEDLWDDDKALVLLLGGRAVMPFLRPEDTDLPSPSDSEEESLKAPLTPQVLQESNIEK